jgi:transposase-like protein
MPWQEHRKMSLKMEFVEKASRPGVRMAELCRQYGISRETGYKWLNRFKREGYSARGIGYSARGIGYSAQGSTDIFVVCDRELG